MHNFPMRQSYKNHRLSNFFTFGATFLKVERVYGISLKTKRFREHIVILATLEKSWVWGAASPLSGWKTWMFLTKSAKYGIERVNFKRQKKNMPIRGLSQNYKPYGLFYTNPFWWHWNLFAAVRWSDSNYGQVKNEKHCVIMGWRY